MYIKVNQAYNFWKVDNKYLFTELVFWGVSVRIGGGAS